MKEIKRIRIESIKEEGVRIIAGRNYNTHTGFAYSNLYTAYSNPSSSKIQSYNSLIDKLVKLNGSDNSYISGRSCHSYSLCYTIYKNKNIRFVNDETGEVLEDVKGVSIKETSHYTYFTAIIK